jgi:hypothetical protein
MAQNSLSALLFQFIVGGIVVLQKLVYFDLTGGTEIEAGWDFTDMAEGGVV